MTTLALPPRGSPEASEMLINSMKLVGGFIAPQRNPMRPGDYCAAWRDNHKRCQRGAQCGCAARGKR